MKFKKIYTSERFYYGVVLLTSVLMVLWYELTSAINAILILFFTAMTSDIAQVYSKTMIAKLEQKEKFTSHHVVTIIANDRFVYVFVLLVAPFFLLSYFDIITIDTAYVLASITSVGIFFFFGYYYGRLVQATFKKKISYALLFSMISLSIILLKSLIDNS